MKTKKIIFTKTYTRDTTLIIQQSWHDVIAYAFKKTEDLLNPQVPPVIHYMNDGVIEVWENKAATQWFSDNLQEKIKKNESFIAKILNQYQQDLKIMKTYWNRGVMNNKKDFRKYVDLVFDFMNGFVFMYYTSIDERTPEYIRKRALKMRDKDTYFDANDRLLRDSLLAIYPKLKGYETAVLRNEINNLPSIDVLKKRKKNFIIIGEVESQITTLDKYRLSHPEFNFQVEYLPEDTGLLKGKTGYGGHVKGIVRILKRKEQINSVQKGEILVTAMTTPEFVPAMKKSAAIITDEGGITCHAAIAARELNKPCVIGTKFATQVLKDGDEVEVDANKGVVRILKSDG